METALVLAAMLPLYLCSLMPRSVTQYSLHSQSLLSLSVPKARTEMGKQSFSHNAPSSWNMFQKIVKLEELVSLIDNTVCDNCSCFYSSIVSVTCDTLSCVCILYSSVIFYGHAAISLFCILARSSSQNSFLTSMGLPG